MRTNVLPLFTYQATLIKMPSETRKELAEATTQMLFGRINKAGYPKIIQEESVGEEMS